MKNEKGKLIVSKFVKGTEQISSKLEYQWYKGANPLLNETNEELQEVPRSLNKDESYYCEVRYGTPPWLTVQSNRERVFGKMDLHIT